MILISIIVLILHFIHKKSIPVYGREDTFKEIKKVIQFSKENHIDYGRSQTPPTGNCYKPNVKIMCAYARCQNYITMVHMSVMRKFQTENIWKNKN